MILRERNPVERFAPLLGPRVGLRARRPLAAALRAPFAFTMPASGGLVTFTAGKEPRWNVEALRGMGIEVPDFDADRTSWAHQTAEPPTISPVGGSERQPGQAAHGPPYHDGQAPSRRARVEAPPAT
jgi:hypothetical protein